MSYVLRDNNDIREKLVLKSGMFSNRILFSVGDIVVVAIVLDEWKQYKNAVLKYFIFAVLLVFKNLKYSNIKNNKHPYIAILP